MAAHDENSKPSSSEIESVIFLKEGTLVDGRFQIEELIIHEAGTSIYSARHLLLDREITLKFLHSHLEKDLENFHKEAQYDSSAQKIYGIGFFNNQPFIAVELVHDSSQDSLDNNEATCPNQILNLIDSAKSKWKLSLPLVLICICFLIAVATITQRVSGTTTSPTVKQSKHQLSPVTLKSPADKGVLTTADKLRLAHHEYLLAIQEQDAQESIFHLKNALKHYSSSVNGTLIGNKPTLASLRVYTAISESALACVARQIQYGISPDEQMLQIAEIYAKKVCAEQPEHLQFLPDDLIIPEGTLNSTNDAIAVAHTVLATLYTIDPVRYGSVENALKHCQTAIELDSVGDCLLLTYAVRTKALILARQGKILEAQQALSELQEQLPDFDADNAKKAQINDILLKSHTDLQAYKRSR